MASQGVDGWITGFRDVLLVVVAAFMLVFGTIFVTNPALLALIIGGGLSAFGVPAALRLDSLRRRIGTEQDAKDSS